MARLGLSHLQPVLDECGLFASSPLESFRAPGRDVLRIMLSDLLPTAAADNSASSASAEIEKVLDAAFR